MVDGNFSHPSAACFRGADTVTDTPSLTHEYSLLKHLGMDPSRANLAFARRRVMRAGRLAQLGAHMVDGVLDVQVIDHGGPDYMAEGDVFARVLLDAPESDLGARALQLEQGLAEVAQSRGQRLMLAVYRATERDCWRERVRWAFRWPR